MNIHPVTTETEHKAALKEIERLWDAREGSNEAIKLDILTTLVEMYEAKHFAVETEGFDPIDTLNFLIDEGGHTQAELGEILGSRSRASEVLNRKRALTVEMIHRISTAWKIPADLLVQPYDLVRRTSALVGEAGLEPAKP